MFKVPQSPKYSITAAFQVQVLIPTENAPYNDDNIAGHCHWCLRELASVDEEMLKL